MSAVKAQFDGRVFVPEGPVDLPVGSWVEIPIEEERATEPSERPLMRLLEVLDRFPENPDWPVDGASQHDHYLYGTPKRP